MWDVIKALLSTLLVILVFIASPLIVAIGIFAFIFVIILSVIRESKKGP